jgi:hypothetical protein
MYTFPARIGFAAFANVEQYWQSLINHKVNTGCPSESAGILQNSIMSTQALEMIDPTIQEICLSYWVHWQYSKMTGIVLLSRITVWVLDVHTLLCCWTQHYDHYLVTELVSRQ